MYPSSAAKNPTNLAVDSPRIWVVLGEKQGDNGQVEVIQQALPWRCERKNVQMLPPYVLGKPRVAASLDHIDKARSDPLEPPWPDLIITVGRRLSNVALWIRKQSQRHTKIVLVAKPSGMVDHFDLVIHSSETLLPPLPNVVRTTLPLMQVNEAAVHAAAETWQPRWADLPRPLIAILVGGPTNPFVYPASVADRLLEIASGIATELGGTPFITTSRRTPAMFVDKLQSQLPAGAQFYRWTPDSTDNPYRGLLGLADGFVVTGDSISMMVEVVRLHKPLAILDVPRSLLGRIDQLRRSFAGRLFSANREGDGRTWQRLAPILYKMRILNTRDFLTFHAMLIANGLAVRAGEKFHPPKSQLPDDLPAVVARIKSLMDQNPKNSLY